MNKIVTLIVSITVIVLTVWWISNTLNPIAGTWAATPSDKGITKSFQQAPSNNVHTNNAMFAACTWGKNEDPQYCIKYIYKNVAKEKNEHNDRNDRCHIPYTCSGPGIWLF